MSEGKRQSGRTTRQLERVVDDAASGKYRDVLWVSHRYNTHYYDRRILAGLLDMRGIKWSYNKGTNTVCLPEQDTTIHLLSADSTPLLFQGLRGPAHVDHSVRLQAQTWDLLYNMGCRFKKD